MIDLELVLPDGTVLVYGEVPDGTIPAVREVISFQRSDPLSKLVPDSHGLEGERWIVLAREWTVRTRAGLDPYRVTFLTLRSDTPPGSLL